MAAEPLQHDPARLAAGTKVPRSGIYRVYHYRHRLPHSVILLKNDVLPACHHCGDRVEFVELMDGDVCEADYNFSLEQADDQAA
ncbi:MAG: hypothetical protein HYX28_09905 [Candidatus Koribacter versatilis]|uniref:Uncharacterized protein n=1 Tax=Candidatus Korobacter versatilis TaxID=658062 RepID=A0A932AA69_9BACT|nr:hypothetical protein [Candidatus Koribacter versatilis]